MVDQMAEKMAVVTGIWMVDQSGVRMVPRLEGQTAGRMDDRMVDPWADLSGKRMAD
jgi:hypothetical protein